ncbi:MAG TPA: nuclear transport factor 2 family protein [Paucimonas sp.]|nr:nuclear transport factor 2 family protein [Paucimonas sp.]
MTEVFAGLIRQFWKTTADRDWEGLGKVVHEHVLYEVPQTRERVRGRAGFVEFFATYPGEWTLEVESIVNDDKQAVTKIAFNVDGASVTGITFFEFRDRLISRITDYWPESYDPPPRMTPHVERY